MTYGLDPEAQRDLEAYLARVAEDDPAAAVRQDQRTAETLALLARQPRMGRKARIRGLRREVRSFAIPGSPLRVFYVETPGGIHVLRLYHGARRPIGR